MPARSVADRPGRDEDDSQRQSTEHISPSVGPPRGLSTDRRTRLVGGTQGGTLPKAGSLSCPAVIAGSSGPSPCRACSANPSGNSLIRKTLNRSDTLASGECSSLALACPCPSSVRKGACRCRCLCGQERRSTDPRHTRPLVRQLPGRRRGLASCTNPVHVTDLRPKQRAIPGASTCRGTFARARSTPRPARWVCYVPAPTVPASWG